MAKKFTSLGQIPTWLRHATLDDLGCEHLTEWGEYLEGATAHALHSDRALSAAQEEAEQELLKVANNLYRLGIRESDCPGPSRAALQSRRSRRRRR